MPFDSSQPYALIETPTAKYKYFLQGGVTYDSTPPFAVVSSLPSYIAPSSGGGTVSVNGVFYLRMPDGSLMPLAMLMGTPQEPTVAGVVQQVVSLDAGSDVDHVEILYTFNCTTGDPDTADTALASARFTSPDSNAEVVKSGIIGASAGITSPYYAFGGLTMVHFALRGAGPYTVAAGNTLTALQMVVMKFPAVLGVVGVELKVGTATIGGGANKRYRTITVTGYTSV